VRPRRENFKGPSRAHPRGYRSSKRPSSPGLERETHSPQCSTQPNNTIDNSGGGPGAARYVPGAMAAVGLR